MAKEREDRQVSELTDEQREELVVRRQAALIELAGALLETLDRCQQQHWGTGTSAPYCDLVRRTRAAVVSGLQDGLSLVANHQGADS